MSQKVTCIAHYRAPSGEEVGCCGVDPRLWWEGVEAALAQAHMGI